MKSLTPAWVAMAALSTLAACGDGTTSPAATDEVTAVHSPVDAARFRALLADTADLLEHARDVDDQPVPESAEAANQVFGLDETSPLRFGDLVETGDHSGRLCLVSDDDTYLALDSDVHDVLLGDGDCSYDVGDAVVVGSLVSGAWTQGADLMGDAELGDVFPVGRSSVEGTPETD